VASFVPDEHNYQASYFIKQAYYSINQKGGARVG
jgi:hypothetical protein